MGMRRNAPRRVGRAEFNALPVSVREAIVAAEDAIIMDRFDEVYPCTGVNGTCAATGQVRPDATPPRIWFYRPRLYVGGLSPVRLGGDEWCRRTFVVGYPFTGQVVIPLFISKECR